MNMIEQQICDAIEIIVDRAIEQANYDKTIQVNVDLQDQYIGKDKYIASLEKTLFRLL